jgi:hypothetical protein
LKPDNLQSNSVLIPSESKIQKVELTLSKSLEDKISSKLENKERTVLDKYGAVLVAIVALFGTLITTLIGTDRSKINLEKQISANKELEYEKKKIEKEHERNLELKDMVAKFILNSSLLNLRFYEIIELVNNGQNKLAHDRYKETHQTRQALIGYYYSIKVALDGSQKQLNLERVLNSYMNLVEFHFDINSISSVQYEQLTGELYHKIKSIIHENYKEPI